MTPEMKEKRDAMAEAAWKEVFSSRVATAEMIYRLRADVLAASEAVKDKESDYRKGYKKGFDAFFELMDLDPGVVANHITKYREQDEIVLLHTQLESSRREHKIFREAAEGEIKKLHQKTYDIDDLYKEALDEIASLKSKLEIAVEALEYCKNTIESIQGYDLEMRAGLSKAREAIGKIKGEK